MAFCNFLTNLRRPCKRAVQQEGERCWQHATGIRNKMRSLHRNQPLIFYLTFLGFILTAVGTYISWRGLRTEVKFPQEVPASQKRSGLPKDEVSPRLPRSESKTITLLVCDFDGPDKKNYRVTEIILEKLNDTFLDFQHIKVVSSGPITAQEGRQKAREKGEEMGATLVLWGWYGKTEKTALVTVHFELLGDLDELPVDHGKDTLSLEVGELETFDMQILLSEHLGALAEVVAGLLRYRARDFETSLKLLDSALKRTKNDRRVRLIDPAIVHFYKGNIHNFLGNCQKAAADFSKSLEYHKENPWVYVNRACSYRCMGQNTKAEQDLLHAIEMDFQFGEAHSNLGTLKFMEGKVSEAAKEYELALKANPGLEKAYFNRSVLFLFQNDLESALTDLAKAIEINPSYALAYGNRAAIWLMKQNPQMAERDLRKAVELDASNPRHWANLGRLFMKLDRPSEAIKVFQRALSINPRVARVHYDKSLTLSKLNRENEALNELTEAIKIDSTFAVAYLHRGVKYAAMNRKSEALSDLNRYISLRPNDPLGYQARVVLHIEKRDKNHAIRDLKTLLKLDIDEEFRKQTEILLTQLESES